MRTAIVSIILLSFTASALGQSAKDKAAMQEKQNEFVKAFKAKDFGWFTRVSTADFVVIDQHGKSMKKEAAMAQMKQELGVLNVSYVDAVIQSVKAKGSNLIVTTKSTIKGTVPGQNGKPAKLVDISTDEEVWVKSGSDWKIKVDKTTSDHATLNGKPVPGM